MGLAARLGLIAGTAALAAGLYAGTARADVLTVIVKGDTGDAEVDVRRIDVTAPTDMQKSLRSGTTAEDGTVTFELTPGLYQIGVLAEVGAVNRAGADYAVVTGAIGPVNIMAAELPEAILPGLALDNLAAALDRALNGGDDAGLTASVAELLRIESMHRGAGDHLAAAMAAADYDKPALAHLTEAAKGLLAGKLDDDEAVFATATGYARALAAVNNRIRANEKAGVPIPEEMKTDRDVLESIYFRYKALNEHNVSAKLARGMLVDLAGKVGKLKATAAKTGKTYAVNAAVQRVIDADPNARAAFEATGG